MSSNMVWVIGANGLLGKSVTLHLLAQGATVIATDICMDGFMGTSDRSELQSKGTLHTGIVDINNTQTIEVLIKRFENINSVVNCAYPRNANYGLHFFDVKTESFNDNVNLNLGGAFTVLRLLAKRFKETGKPTSIVNIASIYGVVSPSFDIYEDTLMTTPVEYACIKSALIHLTKYVVKYVNDSRFRVNIVSPGGLEDGQPEAFLEAYQQKCLGKGMLEAKDVVGTIAFLLSPDSRYINGQNIIVDDGFTL